MAHSAVSEVCLPSWTRMPLGNAWMLFHPSEIDKWIAGPFNRMCALWRHLVSAWEIKVHLIGCWQYLGAVCLWKPMGSTWLLWLSCVTDFCEVERSVLLGCVVDERMTFSFVGIWFNARVSATENARSPTRHSTTRNSIFCLRDWQGWDLK